MNGSLPEEQRSVYVKMKKQKSSKSKTVYIVENIHGKALKKHTNQMRLKEL